MHGIVPGRSTAGSFNHSADLATLPDRLNTDLEDFAMTTQAELGERAIGRKPFQHDGVYELKE